MKRLNNIISWLFSALPHLNIALAVSLLVLFVTDRYNRAMAFINNDIAKWMLAVLCVTVVVSSIGQIVLQRRRSNTQQIDRTQGSQDDHN